MKRILLSATAAALIAGPAVAADLPLKSVPPPAPVFGWSGFYIGVGAGIRDAKATDTVTGETLAGLPFGPFSATGAAFCATSGCSFSAPFNASAFRGSLYGGWNFQVAPRWLVGIEADGGTASKTTIIPGMNYPVTGFFATGGGLTSNPGCGPSAVGTTCANDSFGVRTTWDASVRGRVGWLWSPAVLLYVTGGASWIRLETISTCGINSNQTGNAGSALCNGGGFPGFAPTVITDRTTRLGGTIGGGFETMVYPNLILRGEYRYTDYGTANFVDTRLATVNTGNFGPVGTPLTVTHNVRLQTQTATLGVSYLFNWAGGPIATRY